MQQEKLGPKTSNLSKLIIKEHKNKFDLVISSPSRLWKAYFVCEKQLGSIKSHFIGVKCI